MSSFHKQLFFVMFGSRDEEFQNKLEQLCKQMMVPKPATTPLHTPLFRTQTHISTNVEANASVRWWRGWQRACTI